MSFYRTREIRDNILLQLESRKLPFKKYCLCRDEQGLELLGDGAFGSVYAAKKRGKGKAQYAVKVVGFSDKHVDSAEFKKVVNMQKHLNILDKNIVKVFDAVQLRLWIDERDTIIKVQEVTEDTPETAEGDFLTLQFIVMERLQPVLVYDRMGKPRITVSELASFAQEEILKLAVNISAALTAAHSRGVLHRDVKLENIFYEKKTGRYKLGDFGIAKITLDGMASTVAFTKGYGAPEVVGSLEEQYDATADVYSFGVVLFVLLNELKFPGAANYSVNSIEQYSKGYVFPCLEGRSEPFVKMVQTMCRFHPDDRYQTMEAVLNEAEAIMYRDPIDFRRQHAEASKLLGMVMLVGEELVFGLQDFWGIEGYVWMRVSLVMLGLILLYDYVLKLDREPKFTKKFLVGNKLWYFVLFIFLLIFVSGILRYTGGIGLWERVLGANGYFMFTDGKMVKIGLTGSIFSVVWIVRERVLISLRRYFPGKKES